MEIDVESDRAVTIGAFEKRARRSERREPSVLGGLPAKLLKKGIATRWINDVTGPGRAVKAWPDM